MNTTTTEIKRPIPRFIKQMMSDSYIKFEYTYLGDCLIDRYQAPGDLYESWDIVPMNEDGTFDRVPDAGYGSDAPDDDRTVEDFTPVRLWEICTVWDSNGWTKRNTAIYTDRGECLCDKSDG